MRGGILIGEVRPLHGGSDLGLLLMVFLQVPSEGAEVPAAVRTVLSAGERATRADVYVYVVVYVGGGRG